MNEQLSAYINAIWDKSIIPTLMEYIKIPNKSPQFDPKWREHGFMEQAVALLTTWAEEHALPHMDLKVIRLENRTPLIYIEIPGELDKTVLLYGHLDKQPEMSGWDADLGPWQPVLRGDRLYGRGGADDGYALFASLTALKALHELHIPHARCVILIEACEESGSYDLPFYIDALKDQIKEPSLIVCLDSGCGNYDQLWATTSLRGLIGGTLSINVLEQGIHSGAGSGNVPSCFRILRLLLDRIEDIDSGNIKMPGLTVTIPEARKAQAMNAALVLKQSIIEDFPFVKNVQPESHSLAELILRRTWLPALSITGIDGMPLIENAGNVTLPYLKVKLSMRIPPTCDPLEGARLLQKTLEENPPYHAKITFEINDMGPGWDAPPSEKWLAEALSGASKTYFGKEAVYLGEGGSIPFMGMLGAKFPKAQFLITGVLGPGSNAHGPNEFLHLPTGKKLTACVANVIATHYQASR